MEVILRTDGETRNLSTQGKSYLFTSASLEVEDTAEIDRHTNQTERGSYADDDRVFYFTDCNEERGGDQAEQLDIATNSPFSKLIISEIDGGHWVYIRSNIFPRGKQYHQLLVC